MASIGPASLRTSRFLASDCFIGTFCKGLYEDIASKRIVFRRRFDSVLVSETRGDFGLLHKTRNSGIFRAGVPATQVLFLQSRNVVFQDVRCIGEFILQPLDGRVQTLLHLAVLLPELVHFAFENGLLFQSFLVGIGLLLADLLHLLAKHFNDLLVLKFQSHLLL